MTVQLTPDLPQRGEGWLVRGEPRTIAADIDTTAPLTLHLGGGRTSAPVLSLPPSRTDGDLTCWDLSVAQVDQITDGLASVRVWIAAGTTSVVAGQLMVARQGDSAPGGRTVLTADRIVVGPQGASVVSATTSPGGHLVFVLDTGAELDAGMVPVPPSVEAAASSAASSASTATAEAAAAGLSATAAQDAAASAAASASTATTKAAEATSAAASMSAYTAADVLAKLKTVDGAGSGLDADLLDGKDSAGFVDTTTAQAITGVKTMTAPAFVASTPAATFGPDLTPASLGGWTLSGGATWASPNLAIPSGGSVSCTIPVTSGKTYQVDVTRSASSGGDMTVAVGSASISVRSWSNNRVTVIAAATGTLTLTVGGGTWVATVQSIVCREVTATAGPVGSPGASQLRASGNNVASGYNSQSSLTTGNYNVATGNSSQYSLTTGSFNVATGHDAQRSLTTGSNNVASGHGAQRSLTTGSSNVASGYNSQSSLTTGNYNVASGQGSQSSLTTGSSNVATGNAAQFSLTTGSNNVATGYAAQFSLTTGGSNVASGHNAQYSLTTGSSNVASGYDSQRSLTTGSSNVATGNAAQYQPRGVTAWATTTASRQTSIGHESGQGSSTPSDDIVTVGYRATADGAKAMALGSMASAAHAGSVALGSDVTTTAAGQVAVGARDVEVQDATKGLVLRSPDGSRWRATINNAGVTAWTKIV